jgi:RNA polymerase sigma factor (TIGR02999 family)
MRGKEVGPAGGGTSADMFTSLYAELRRIAAAQMLRSDRSSTLQPTALVHEAWLHLSTSDRAQWRDQSHFVAAAATTMRHILIDRARRRRATKHGGGQQRVGVDQIELPSFVAADEGVLACDEALKKLAEHHPEAALLIELQCFGGLDVAESARVLGIPRSTAYRRWLFAQAWLKKELKGADR